MVRFEAHQISAPDWISSGTATLAATANIAYDYNDFSSASGLEDDDAVRRKEFGATLKKKGVYDAMVYYDFQADTWLDVFVRFESKAFFGRDVGRFRLAGGKHLPRDRAERPALDGGGVRRHRPRP